MSEGTLKRIGIGLCAALAGSGALLAMLLVMNEAPERDKKESTEKRVEIKLAERKKETRSAVRETVAPPRKKLDAPRLARPALGADLSALGSGLALFDTSATSDLAGDVLNKDEAPKDLVMTGETVDEQPQPAADNPPPAPPKDAIRKRIRGHVVVRMVIDTRGSVENVKVLNAEPPGVFEDAVLDAVRGWRFAPATYRGTPVSVRVDQTVRFDLG